MSHAPKTRESVAQNEFDHGFACLKCCEHVKLTVVARTGSRERIDGTSRAIIEQLQADGRRSYAAIGQAVGLSEAAVRQRVQKLVDSGVMQIVAVTDPMQTGFARQAMVSIEVTGDVESIAEQLAKIPEVDYIVVTAGSWDILAEVVVEDDAHLLRLVNGEIRTIEGVTRTESFLYLKLVKQTYNWGAR
jgi:Lrp/AsnC family transcriptional regulator, regulator for asnA, asnC and gidA